MKHQIEITPKIAKEIKLAVAHREWRKTHNDALQYNPIIKNGKFRIYYGGYCKTYRTDDAAGAAWKMSQFLGVEYLMVVKLAHVVQIEPTLRALDLAD